jgi:predicted  nucleic acid-binding Zn-ribbon protein
MPTVNEQIEETEIDRLAALQEVDRRLKDRRDRMAALVSEADGYETDLTRQRDLTLTLTSERDALEQRRITMDRQLDVSGNKIRDNRMRMNRVRNSTELLALQREIDLSKEANMQVEEELLRVMETIESLTVQLTEAQALLRQLEEQAEATVATRRGEAEALRQEVEAERGYRESLAAGMDPSVRSKYEQLFERRGGAAVVAARSGICTGCRMHIPPQLYNELQKYRAVVRQCPNCHRILYWRPEPAE